MHSMNESSSKPRIGEHPSELSNSNLGSQSGQRGFFGTSSVIKNYSAIKHDSSQIEPEGTYIQGTMLNIDQLKNTILQFFREFRPKATNMDVESNDSDSLYIEELKQLHETSSYYLVISVRHIKTFSRELYFNLITYAAEAIELFDLIATMIYRELFGNEGFGHGVRDSVFTTFIGFERTTPIREINTDKINRLFAVKGIVIRCSDIYPEMKAAYLKCVACGKGCDGIPIIRGQIQEPRKCNFCQTSSSFELIHNLCTFTDKQHVKLQETPEFIPEGGMPSHINLIVYDDLVDSVKPGDYIDVVGIYRVQSSRVSVHQRVLNSVFGTYFDVVSLTSAHDNKVILHSEQSAQQAEATFSEEEILQFRNFASSSGLYDELIASFAPSLLELKDVKKGLLCQLFGGAPKDFAIEYKSRFRNELNVLLIGDPSTAKSQLLQFAHKVSSRGIFTSGKGSSAVGLTAYITKDVDTHELILESGALVLSDQGICCIDEFDKMSEDTASILHEAMEQQTISIAKAGIVCSLNARTGVLAAANPRESRYNFKRPITYNLTFPPSILSRFDLIYIMLDKVDSSNDASLARHILSLYQPFENLSVKAYRDEKFLRKYVQFARKTCSPKLDEEAGQEAVRGYLEMRRLGMSRNTITATPRQLESVLRIAEAIARMRLSLSVEVADIREAVRLVREATQAAAFDPVTGQVDMNIISTGYSSSMKARIGRIVEELKRILHSQESLFRIGYSAQDLRKEILAILKARGEELDEISPDELLKALKDLQDEKRINIVGNERSENYLVKLIKVDS